MGIHVVLVLEAAFSFKREPLFLNLKVVDIKKDETEVIEPKIFEEHSGKLRLMWRYSLIVV